MCGAWGGVDHWSNAARLPGASGAETPPLRLRMLQEQALRNLALHAGVTVRDWQHTAWLVEHPSGATEVAESLPRVWEAVARLTGRTPDPLAPPWLPETVEAGE